MQIINFVLLSIFIIALGILYQKYLDKKMQSFDANDYSDIQKYLLKDTRYLLESDKPILWIHIPYEYNSRDWLDFGSRSSFQLNQPYLYLTTKTIIKNCDQSFKIVIIDDNTFEKLIPDWSVNLNILSDHMKCYMRQLAITKLIYNYGGLNVPISFLCFRDLIGLYNRGISDDNMFVCENYDTNITSTNKLFYPNAHFIGAKKENQIIREFINFMEITISDDYTAQTKFLGEFDKWCDKKIARGKVRLIPGTDVGTKTIDGEPILIENLLGDDYINFYGKSYGIWIPDREILKRRHYEWFARMSPEQIFESQFILAKYFVLSLAPDSHMGVIEPMDNAKEDWISFWRVPLTNGTLNVFGPKPILLGNNIPRARNAGNLP